MRIVKLAGLAVMLSLGGPAFAQSAINDNGAPLGPPRHHHHHSHIATVGGGKSNAVSSINDGGAPVGPPRHHHVYSTQGTVYSSRPDVAAEPKDH